MLRDKQHKVKRGKFDNNINHIVKQFKVLLFIGTLATFECLA